MMNNDRNTKPDVKERLSSSSKEVNISHIITPIFGTALFNNTE